jgi:hypothetical protein
MPGSVWIVKPGENTNRGSGISIHNTKETICAKLSGHKADARTYII